MPLRRAAAKSKECAAFSLQAKPEAICTFLKIENTYDGLALQEGKTFLSRKGTSDDHGIGLSSVRKIIESHGGDLDLVPGEESFLAGITIQM